MYSPNGITVNYFGLLIIHRNAGHNYVIITYRSQHPKQHETHHPTLPIKEIFKSIFFWGEKLSITCVTLDHTTGHNSVLLGLNLCIKPTLINMQIYGEHVPMMLWHI